MAFLLALLVPPAALACEISPVPAGWRDEAIEVGADCSYTKAGATFLNDIEGSAAVKVGDCISVGERAMSAADAAEPAAGSIAFANPKSRTLTFPSMEALMF